jgi:hypothetical protein
VQLVCLACQDTPRVLGRISDREIFEEIRGPRKCSAVAAAKRVASAIL